MDGGDLEQISILKKKNSLKNNNSIIWDTKLYNGELIKDFSKNHLDLINGTTDIDLNNLDMINLNNLEESNNINDEINSIDDIKEIEDINYNSHHKELISNDKDSDLENKIYVSTENNNVTIIDNDNHINSSNNKDINNLKDSFQEGGDNQSIKDYLKELNLIQDDNNYNKRNPVFENPFGPIKNPNILYENNELLNSDNKELNKDYQTLYSYSDISNKDNIVLMNKLNPIEKPFDDITQLNNKSDSKLNCQN